MPCVAPEEPRTMVQKARSSWSPPSLDKQKQKGGMVSTHSAKWMLSGGWQIIPSPPLHAPPPGGEIDL